MTNIFSADFKTKKELKTSAGAPIADVAKREIRKDMIKIGMR